MRNGRRDLLPAPVRVVRRSAHDGHALGLAEDRGRLIFKVEPYHRHFGAEADRLYAELVSLVDPQIPPPLIKGNPVAARPAPPVVSPTS